jgi:hypothetical protein
MIIYNYKILTTLNLNHDIMREKQKHKGLWLNLNQ